MKTCARQNVNVILEFSGKIWYWRGPAPHYFVTVPDKLAREIKEVASSSTYGWGMIPVDAVIRETEWYTALWPKDGSYVVPIKLAIRRAEQLEEGDTVDVRLKVRFKNS